MDIQLLSNYDLKLVKAVKNPLWALSIKYDGICVYTTDDGPRTRNGKTINNPFLREFLSGLPSGLQGEICAANHRDSNAFKLATSLVMTKHITEERHKELFNQCQFIVFNTFDADETSDFNAKPWSERIIQTFIDDIFVQYLKYEEIRNELAFDADALKYRAELIGGEGLVLFDLNAPYTFGRAKHAFKIKLLNECEAIIVRFEEEYIGHNLKKVPESEWGKPKRIARNLIVYNERFGEFTSGTGLSKAQKVDIYNNFEENWLNKTCTVQFMPVADKAKPRMPRFKGIREDK